MRSSSPIGGWSLFSRHAVSYLLVVAVVFVLFGAYFYSAAKRHLEGEIGRKLEDIALIAARNAPHDRLALVKVGDDRSRMVLRLKEKLEDIRAATGVENITIARPDAGVLIDPRSVLHVGDKTSWPRINERHRAALERGESINTGSYRPARGGFFMTAYAPVMDNGGRLYAVVAVDAGAAEIEVLENLRGQLLATIGVGAASAVALSLLLARSLARPIRSMALAAERIGGGDYDARVEEPSTREMRTLATALNDMAEQIRRRDLALKEMSARVAHEIRNPLNSITLLVRLLEEEAADLGQARSSTFDTLKDEIGKLNRFLSEYLTYSRPVVFAKAPCRPEALAARAVAMASAESKSKNVAVRVSTASRLPEIFVDRARMEQALLNLLLNAVQAAPEGGTVSVTIARDDAVPDLRFAIDDDGPGLAPEVLEHLFEPFFTTRHTGTGLGLANARSIIEGHSGVLTAENTPSGARFVVRIPLGGLTRQEAVHG